jgi:hypothetical protein
MTRGWGRKIGHAVRGLRIVRRVYWIDEAGRRHCPRHTFEEVKYRWMKDPIRHYCDETFCYDCQSEATRKSE